MPFYALSTIPLICRLPNNVIQAWYADDTSACGITFHYLDHTLAVFLMHLRLGLLSKISTSIAPHLWVVIGSNASVAQYVSKISTWIIELKLSSFAITQPLAAYFAFTHGLVRVIFCSNYT